MPLSSDSYAMPRFVNWRLRYSPVRLGRHGAVDHRHTRMDRLDTRMDRLETRVDGLDDRLRAVEIEFGKIDQRLATLERIMLPSPSGE